MENKEGKQITVRIEPYINVEITRYKVEIKRWWGWQKLYDTRFIEYAIGFINELSEIRNVLWLK
jgi:hypothetical protein